MMIAATATEPAADLVPESHQRNPQDVITWSYMAFHSITCMSITVNYKQLHCNYTLLHACNGDVIRLAGMQLHGPAYNATPSHTSYGVQLNAVRCM